MVRSLQRRVAALEAQAGGGDDCGYCGGDDDNGDAPLEVIFEDELPEDFEENCPRCGRELITTIFFDDDPRAPWNA